MVFNLRSVIFPKSMLGYKGDILPSSRSLSKRGMLELPLVSGHFLCMECMCWQLSGWFLHYFLKPLFNNLRFSLRNSTVCSGQDLKQFPFWNYFLVVSCEEFSVAVNPSPLSYYLFFNFVNCFDTHRSLFPERRSCFSVFSFKKCLALL